MQTKEQCLTTKLALSRALIKIVFILQLFVLEFSLPLAHFIVLFCFIMRKKGLELRKKHTNNRECVCARASFMMKQQNVENAARIMCNVDLIAHINVSFR